MRPVINLLSHFAELRNRPITLLVSTTGDTGPAAVHAVNDASNPLLTILVHYPHGQISDFQRKQLTTLQSNYVKVASFEGGGDDMDWPIKETLLSSKKNDGKGEVGGERLFCGINSYNIGRPLFQMTLFIWIYLRMAEKLGVSPGDESRYIILLFSLLLTHIFIHQISSHFSYVVIQIAQLTWCYQQVRWEILRVLIWQSKWGSQSESCTVESTLTVRRTK